MKANVAAHLCHIIGSRMAVVSSHEMQQTMIEKFWEEGDNCYSHRYYCILDFGQKKKYEANSTNPSFYYSSA